MESFNLEKQIELFNAKINFPALVIHLVAKKLHELEEPIGKNYRTSWYYNMITGRCYWGEAIWGQCVVHTSEHAGKTKTLFDIWFVRN